MEKEYNLYFVDYHAGLYAIKDVVFGENLRDAKKKAYERIPIIKRDYRKNFFFPAPEIKIGEIKIIKRKGIKIISLEEKVNLLKEE